MIVFDVLYLIALRSRSRKSRKGVFTVAALRKARKRLKAADLLVPKYYTIDSSRGAFTITLPIPQQPVKPKIPEPPDDEPPAHRRLYDYTVNTQAERVLLAFGGARALSRALKAAGRPKDATCIYKWTYPYPKGTGGRIPEEALRDVKLAAQAVNLKIPSEWFK